MLLKPLFAITTLLAMGSTAFAGSRYNLDSKHIQLMEAVQSTGITVKINPSSCYVDANKKLYGWYWAAHKEFVVCQDQSSEADANTLIYFTDEDLDTIRHEAQHLIQDCMDEELNGSLHSVYREPLVLGKKVLGSAEVSRVFEAYSDMGNHRQIMEVEAFAVAAMNDPMEQVADIKKYCF